VQDRGLMEDTAGTEVANDLGGRQEIQTRVSVYRPLFCLGASALYSCPCHGVCPGLCSSACGP
jgi:hypothetical protein